MSLEAQQGRGSGARFTLAAILAVAAALRLGALSRLPPAHYRDVATTALDALRAAAGHPRLHYVFDEGLFANLMGLLFRLAGASDLTVRLPGAAAGILTCAATARLGRALGSPRAGRAGAFLMAVSLWHVILSRSGFRAVLLPLFLALAIAGLVDGLRRGGAWRLAGAGALFGLCAHTYPASRAAVLLLPIVLAAELRLDRALWGRAARGLLAFALAAAVVAGPMVFHYLRHPRDFNNPDRIVSIFSPRLEPGAAPDYLERNLVDTLLMFHLRGDANWRHNIAGAPMLDPLTGILFVLGIGAAILMLRGGFERLVERPRAAGAILLGWTAVMLLPNLLSVEGVPHGLRSAGVLPAVMLLAGFGALLAEDIVRHRLDRRVRAAACLAACAALAAWTAHRYFVTWGENPEVAAAHDGAFRAAARVLMAAPPGVERFLVTNGTGFKVYGLPAEVQPYLFEMRDRPPRLLGPKDAALLELDGRPALVALVRRDEQVLALLRRLNPGAAIEPVEGPGISPESPVYRVH